MKKIGLLFLLLSVQVALLAQEKEEKEEKEKSSFKENLFTGGSISAGFGSNYFLIGGSPVFGYSVTNWLDAGIVINYNYQSWRNYSVPDDKLRQTTYGGGPFLKIYPVRFLFLQAQFEENFIKQKYIYPGSNYIDKRSGDASSFLIGGGYTSGRYGRGGNSFFYMSVLFDIGDDPLSPYKNSYGQAVPILAGGIQVPLFQGRGRGE
jgi:hypothetical protein